MDFKDSCFFGTKHFRCLHYIFIHILTSVNDSDSFEIICEMAKLYELLLHPSGKNKYISCRCRSHIRICNLTPLIFTFRTLLLFLREISQSRRKLYSPFVNAGHNSITHYTKRSIRSSTFFLNARPSSSNFLFFIFDTDITR